MPFLKTEEEIKFNWECKADYPLVTFCCFMYNHEKYAVQTLNSLLSQVTSFPFEIIIHDDASQDKTPEIIKRYQAKYPSIIKAICQSENQYSKMGFKLNKFVIPLVRSKYVAICEGDDYWSHPLKTEKQVNFLLNNPKYAGCSCYTKKLVENGEHYCESKTSLKPISHGTLSLVLGKKKQLSTSALLYPADVLKNISQNLDESVYALDNFIRYAISMKGRLYVLPEYMTVYRIHSGGIWSCIGSIKQRDRIIHDLKAACRFLGFPWNLILYLRIIKNITENNIYRAYLILKEYLQSSIKL